MEKFEVKNKKLFKYCAGSLKKNTAKQDFLETCSSAGKSIGELRRGQAKSIGAVSTRMWSPPSPHVITGNIDRRVAERKLEMKQKKWK